MSLLYITFDILLIGYIFIVGIGKRTLIIRLVFRSSSVIWALIFLLIGFYLDYFTDPTFTHEYLYCNIFTNEYYRWC